MKPILRALCASVMLLATTAASADEPSGPSPQFKALTSKAIRPTGTTPAKAARARQFKALTSMAVRPTGTPASRPSATTLAELTSRLSALQAKNAAVQQELGALLRLLQSNNRGGGLGELDGVPTTQR